ncbi:zinc ribbon domain-containing protein [Motilibacter deserti]|uniref:Zinc ribbon domain-containing protein n=1 Tax=Motilibacter deserti TaxID=2714956 RepID=A0ABX0GVG1_9ACTN|nr:zinc ribbon domain-containing protein [Motilibacter deserti]NHC13794.1 zinc ribbon domain-containing protein [Motilibacter deserti]
MWPPDDVAEGLLSTTGRWEPVAATDPALTVVHPQPGPVDAPSAVGAVEPAAVRSLEPALERQRVVARQPERARRRPPPEEPREPLPQRGELECERCRTDNPAGLRFCRKCGAPLAVQAAAVPEPAAPMRVPWWRRLVLELRRIRWQFRRVVSRRVLAVRMIGIALVAALVGVPVLALAGVLHPQRWPRAVWHLVSPQSSTVAASAQLVDGSEDADFPPAGLVDEDTTTAWATSFPGRDAPALGEECMPAPGRGAQAVRLTLPGPTDLRRIGVVTGVTSADRVEFYRPSVVQLQFSDGGCERMSLEDSPEVQWFPVETDGTTSVVVSVLDARPPAAGPDRRATIAQIILRQKG